MSNERAVRVVAWEMPYEDGGFSSVWTTKEAAEAECRRLNVADSIGQHFEVVEVRLDTPQEG